MKRAHLLFVSAVAILTPVAILAQTSAGSFQGPPTGQQPPAGNRPGVIWDVSSGGSQPNAKIDIGNNTTFHGIKGDIGLLSGNAFRVDTNGPATFNMGNWYGGKKPLTFNIFGDMMLIDNGQGNIGSMSANEYCLSGDCIQAWPTAGGGGTMTGITAGAGILVTNPGASPTVALDQNFSDGRYVKKVGDSMSGQLTINSGQARGISILMSSSTDFGLSTSNSNAAGVGIYGYGGNTGGYFLGAKNGVIAYGEKALNATGNGANGTSSTGIYATSYDTATGMAGQFKGGKYTVFADGNGVASTAVTGYNAPTGGYLRGTTTGLSAQADTTNAGTIAVKGDNAETGGYFSGSKNSVEAKAKTLGTGTAVLGWNGQIGGDFSGSKYGVKGYSGDVNGIGGYYFGDLKGIEILGNSARAGSIGLDSHDAETAGLFSGKVRGVDASGPTAGLFSGTTYGVYASTTDGIAGGYFVGKTYGIDARMSYNNGVGTAVHGVGGGTGGDFGGWFYGVTAQASSSGIAVYGSKGTTGGAFSGSLYGVDASTTAAVANSAAVRGRNAESGGLFTGTRTGVEGSGAEFGARLTGSGAAGEGVNASGTQYGGFFSGGTSAVYGKASVAAASGGEFYESSGGNYAKLGRDNWAIESHGGYYNDIGGITLNNTDVAFQVYQPTLGSLSPLVTRKENSFTNIVADGLSGVGRIGLFSQSGDLYMTAADVAGSELKLGFYQDSRTLLSKLTIPQTGSMTASTGLTITGGALVANSGATVAGTLNVNGSITVNSDLSAANNTLSGCAWTTSVPDGTNLLCPSTSPIMNGIVRSGTTMSAYCCDL
jgi:hypothetical protein